MTEPEKRRAPIGATFAVVQQGKNYGRGYYYIKKDGIGANEHNVFSFKYFAWADDVLPPPDVTSDNVTMESLEGQLIIDIYDRIRRIIAEIDAIMQQKQVYDVSMQNLNK